MSLLVLQHVTCEPPGSYTAALTEHAAVRTIMLGEQEIPDPREFEGVVAMGGPMGLGNRAALTWLDSEVDALRTALDAGIPVFGVCLGAQLLAAAAGGRVYAGPRPEVGIGEVRTTPAAADDPVFRWLPAHIPVLHWHSDTFTLPPGSVLLATSGQYPNQAFRVGPSYGLQFHLEARWSMAEQWLELPEYRDSLHAALGADGEQRLRADLLAAEHGMTRIAHDLIRCWLAVCVDDGVAG